MRKLLAYVLAAFLACSPAHAQWQVPAGQIPIGKGAGQTGFNSATLSGLFDAACSTTVGQVWVRLSGGWGCTSLGYANPVWWGADPTNTTDSSTAFISAYNTGLCIEWPNGTFKLNSQFAQTLGSSTATFCMHGRGATLTKLNWPNASGGIAITGNGIGFNFNAVDIRNIALTTSQASGGLGLSVSKVGNISTAMSVVEDVVIQGDDYFPGSGSHYWTIGVNSHLWQYAAFNRITINGKWANPISGSLGIGMNIEGDGTNYTQTIKVTNSTISYLLYPVVLGSYWQGIFFDQTNFYGYDCVIQAGSAGGILVQLVISNSIFYCSNTALSLNTVVIEPVITNSNVIIADTAGLGGFILGGSWGGYFSGNFIQGAGTTSTNNGISMTGASAVGNIITGNYFTTVIAGIVFGTSSSGNVAALNAWGSIGSSGKITNLGGANSYGTAAAGAMTGVVP